MNFVEKFISRSFSIRGNAVGFNIDLVRLPDGNQAKREYLDHPGAVAVVPVIANKIVMVRQYRHPVGKMTWEIPAGKLGKGERPRACVKRELQEETGYRAGRIRPLMSFWPTPAFANEIIHIFVADKLTAGKTSPDEDEFIDAEAWPLRKVFQQIRSGKIKDSKTIIGLLAYQQFIRHSRKL